MQAPSALALASDYRCDRCNRYYAQAELREIRAGSGSVLACPACGDLVRRELSRAARPLPALMAGAFLYPFRGTMIMWTVALLVATTFLRFIPVLGGLIAASAEVGFLFAVLRSTAAGQDELKVEASDLSDFTTWLSPLFKYLVVVAVSFFPAIAAAVLLGGAGEGGAVRTDTVFVVYGLAALGVLYFPAALVVAAHSSGCLGAFNPVAGFTFIARIPGAYFITIAFITMAIGAGAGMHGAASLIDVTIVRIVAQSVAALYGPLVAMRMLGLLMEEHAEEL